MNAFIPYLLWTFCLTLVRYNEHPGRCNDLTLTVQWVLIVHAFVFTVAPVLTTSIRASAWGSFMGNFVVALCAHSFYDRMHILMAP
jgi:hypothetical protein